MTILSPFSLLPDLFNGRINIGSDSFRLILLASTYAPDMAIQSRRSDFAAHELPTAGGYTQGGISSTITTATDPDTGIVQVSLTGGTLGDATNQARYGAWVKWTGTAANDVFLLLIDFGRDTPGPFIIPTQRFDGYS